MTFQRTLDVSALPTFEISNTAPLWWGQVFLAVIEGTMFCILVAMYFYTRLVMDVWPPPGVRQPNQLLASACVVLLILSCIGSYLASEAAKRNDRRGMIAGMALNVVLASGALLLRGTDWISWNFKWDTTAYGSIVWAMMFLHTLDVVADLVFTFVLVVIVAVAPQGPRQRLGVHVDSIIWYFLVAIWIPLYITIYWGPVLVGTPR